MVQEVGADSSREVPVLAPAEETLTAERLGRGIAQKAIPVDRRWAGLLIDVVLPDTVGVIRRVAGLRHDDRPGQAAGNHPASLLVRRIRYPLAADLQNPSRFARHGSYLPSLVDGLRHRLLEVDVLAGAHRVNRHLRMPVVRGCHDHRVDVVAGQQVLVGVVDVGIGEADKFLGPELGPLIDVAGRYDAQNPVLPHHRQQPALEVPRADVPYADDADANAVVRAQGPASAQRSSPGNERSAVICLRRHRWLIVAHAPPCFSHAGQSERINSLACS